MNPTWDVLRAARRRARGRRRRRSPSPPARPRVTYSVLNIAARRRQHRLASSTLYGGTYNLFAHTLPQYGIEVRFVDPDDPEALAALVDDKTKARLRRDDRQPEAERRRHRGVGRRRARAGPAADRRQHGADAAPAPASFEHGADIVVHSATKYIGGHGTSIGGVIVDSGKFDWVANAERFPGLTEPDPSLPRRGLGRRARPGRLHRPRPHGAAAQHRRGAVAVQRVPVPPGPRDAAAAHGAPQRERARGGRATSRATPGVTWVNYPGLAVEPVPATSPTASLTGGYGALVTFGIEGGREAGQRVHREPRAVLATSPTSATPSRWRSTPRRRRTRS